MTRYVKYIQAATDFDLVDPSIFEGTPFTWTKASGYEDFLNSQDAGYYREHKNKQGEIVLMTPAEYVTSCAENFGHGTTAESLIEQRTDDLLPEYEEAMRNGDKFPLCYIDYTGGQEGLHRMIAAGNVFGWDKLFPVLVVKPYDEQKYYMDQMYDDCRRFITYGDFKVICENAIFDVALNYPEFSEGLLPEICNKIEIEAATHHDDEGNAYDIKVKIDIEDDDQYSEGYHQFCIYITEYMGCVFTEYLPGPLRLLVEDYFATDTQVDMDDTDTIFDQTYDDTLAEAEAQGIDLNDYDSIMKLFFKKYPGSN